MVRARHRPPSCQAPDSIGLGGFLFVNGGAPMCGIWVGWERVAGHQLALIATDGGALVTRPMATRQAWQTAILGVREGGSQATGLERPPRPACGVPFHLQNSANSATDAARASRGEGAAVAGDGSVWDRDQTRVISHEGEPAAVGHWSDHLRIVHRRRVISTLRGGGGRSRGGRCGR